MSGSGGGVTGDRTPASPVRLRRRWFPFWVLQAVEVVIAVVFVDISIHVTNGGLLVGSAAVIFVLATTAKGPLGIIRVCGQSLHLVLAVVVGVVVAIAPVVPALRPDIEGLIVIEFGAIGLIRMSTLTAVTPVGRRAGFGPPGLPVIDASARAAGPVPAPARPARTSVTGAGATADAAARWMGRTAGTATISGQKAVARYGPVAGAGVRRTLRIAGRTVGRVTSTSEAEPAPTSGPGERPQAPGAERPTPEHG